MAVIEREKSHLALDEDGQPLPPIDGGPQAWRFVIGVYFLEGLLWGFPLTFGIFQAHYSKHELFRHDEKLIPVVGATITGIAHMGYPMVSPFALRFYKYQLHMVWTGWFLCLSSVFLASYSQNVVHLIMTQGVLYGIGWVLTYVPFLIMMNDWFVKKRGMVYGIVYGSSGVAGLILPYVLESLLARYGFRITLRVSAIGMAVLTGPGMLLIRRYPSPKQTKAAVASKPGLLRDLSSALQNKIFVLFAIASFLQGVSFYIPRFFIPSFAHSIPLSENAGATCLAIWSLAQVVGQMSLGTLADKVSIFAPATLSTLASSLSALFLWGPAKSFWPLAAFSGVYGTFSPAYSVMWSQTTRILGSTKEEATMMFAILSLGRGIGNEIAGPASAWLLGDTVDVPRYALEKYKGNVMFVGATMAVASLTWIGWFWRDSMHDDKKDYREVQADEEDQELDAFKAFEISGSEDDEDDDDLRSDS